MPGHQLELYSMVCVNQLDAEKYSLAGLTKRPPSLNEAWRSFHGHSVRPCRLEFYFLWQGEKFE